MSQLPTLPVVSKPPTRPIPSRAQAGSFSIAASESALTLKYALNNMTPDALHQRILDSLDKLIPSQVDKLATAVESTGIILHRARVVVRDKESRHCARCHVQYLETDNGLNACVIPHYYPVVKKPEEGSGQRAHLVYPCCGGRSDIGARAQPCQKGRHTSTAALVDYRPHNIKTCEQAKCFAAPRGAM